MSIFTAIGLASHPPRVAAQDIDLTGYTLVFSDEFDTLSVGSHMNKGSAKWGDYPPYGAAAAFSFSHWMGSYPAEISEVATISSSVLSLWTKYYPELADPGGRDWISGVIASKDILNQGFAQRFGYWSARMKMPDAGQGAWSAFWLASTSGIPSAGSLGYEVGHHGRLWRAIQTRCGGDTVRLGGPSLERKWQPSRTTLGGWRIRSLFLAETPLALGTSTGARSPLNSSLSTSMECKLGRFQLIPTTSKILSTSLLTMRCRTITLGNPLPATAILSSRLIGLGLIVCRSLVEQLPRLQQT